MSKQNSKRSTPVAPDVDALASKAAKILHKAAKACLEDSSKVGKGGHLKCAILGFAAVAADNHRALAAAVGTSAEALLSSPLALVGPLAREPVVVESGRPARPAEDLATSTNTDTEET